MTKPHAIAMTNERPGSVAQVHHAEPTITLVGRVAAGFVGRIGLFGPGEKSDLHLTLIIDDPYSGILGFDGQPTTGDIDQIDVRHPADSLSRITRIKTKFYRNEMPTGIVFELPLQPPSGMSASRFSQELIKKAINFSSFILKYSAPQNLTDQTMVDGEYNSSSFMAGVLKSVLGYVPEISAKGYQTPGWENPIPSSYFKGEALR